MSRVRPRGWRKAGPAGRWFGIVGAHTAATLLLRHARRSEDVVGGDRRDPDAAASPGRQANHPPVLASAGASPSVAVDDAATVPTIEHHHAARYRGLLRAIFSDYTALVSLAGLLIYGLVRVAYDAFYARLGVFPEAVGLSEMTIVGRAALYLAMTASVAAVFGGLWLLAVGGLLERSRSSDGIRRRLLFGSVSLTVVAGGLVALGEQLRSLFGSLELAYYCFERCKFNVLNLQTLDDLRDAADKSTRDFSVTTVGPVWLIVVPLVALVVAAGLGLFWTCRPSEQWRATRAGTLFALFATASISAALAAPLLGKLTAAAASEADKSDQPAFIDANAELVGWVVLALVLVAVVLGLLAALSLVVESPPLRSPWVLASFVVVLPLLIGIFQPQVPLFIEEQGLGALAAAVALVGALTWLCWLIAPDRRRERWLTPSLAAVVAAIVWLTLFLAWQRGVNLGSQAAVGDQIYPKRFGLLSVRSSVVCLRPRQKETRLPRKPFIYLGQVGDTLVLYDYQKDRKLDKPTAFPVRMPASDVNLRPADYKVGASAWVCPRSG
jgi:hypothetical protein